MSNKIREIGVNARKQLKLAWVDGAIKEKEIGGYAEIDDSMISMIETLGEGKDHECHFERVFENLFHTHRPAAQTALLKNPPSGNDFVGALSWGGLNNEFNPKFRLRTLRDIVVDEDGIWLIAKPLCKPKFQADGTVNPPDIIEILDTRPSKNERRNFLESIGYITTVCSVLYASNKIDRARFIESVTKIHVPEMINRIDANSEFRAYLLDQEKRNEWVCTLENTRNWINDPTNRKLNWPIESFRIQFEPWTNEEKLEMLNAISAAKENAENNNS